MAHGADAALYFFRIGDAAQRGRHHVAVLEGGNEFRSLAGIVAQPVQQLGKSPLRRIHAAAPLDRFQPFAVSGFGDLRRLALGAMVAPQVVLAERLHVFADRNHRRAGGIERNGLDLIAADAGFLHRLARGGGQGAHVIFVRLGGVFRIFALAVQRIFGNRGFQQPALAVHDRNAHAQRSEIYSRHDGHQQVSVDSDSCQYISQPI